MLHKFNRFCQSSLKNHIGSVCHLSVSAAKQLTTTQTVTVGQCSRRTWIRFIFPIQVHLPDSWALFALPQHTPLSTHTPRLSSDCLVSTRPNSHHCVHEPLPHLILSRRDHLNLVTVFTHR